MAYLAYQLLHGGGRHCVRVVLVPGPDFHGSQLFHVDLLDCAEQYRREPGFWHGHWNGTFSVLGF